MNFLLKHPLLALLSVVIAVLAFYAISSESTPQIFTHHQGKVPSPAAASQSSAVGEGKRIETGIISEPVELAYDSEASVGNETASATLRGIDSKEGDPGESNEPTSAGTVSQRVPPRAQTQTSAAVQNAGGPIAVESRMPLPAAFLESDGALPPALANVKSAIAEGFNRDLNAIAAQPNLSPEAFQKAQREAKRKADDQFRTLFGETAFHEWSMQAARQSVGATVR